MRLIPSLRKEEATPITEPMLVEPRSLVLGIGGGGCNVINRLSHMDPGIRTVAVNTDKKSLTRTQAEQRLLIGSNYVDGKGSDGNQKIGRDAALNAKNPLTKMFKDVDIVFLITGLGGGTGTGATPVIADMAKKSGAYVISMITLPFSMEKKRRKIALKGIKDVRKNSDNTIILDNDKLLGSVPALKARLALSVIDQLVCEVVTSMIYSMDRESMFSLDMQDLMEFSEKGAMTTILWGESPDPYKAISEALNNPLLDTDMNKVDSIMINIAGGRSMTSSSVNMMYQGFVNNMGVKAKTSCTAFQEPERRSFRIMALASGKELDVRY